MTRESQVDNVKRTSVQPRSKAAMSTQIVPPPAMGGWDAPGVEIVTDTPSDDDEMYGERRNPVGG